MLAAEISLVENAILLTKAGCSSGLDSKKIRLTFLQNNGRRRSFLLIPSPTNLISSQLRGQVKLSLN